MKAKILLLAALGVAALVLMGCPIAFVGTAIPAQTLTDVSTAANSGNRTNVGGIAVFAFAAGPYTLAAGQVVEITFTGSIDASSLGAVIFYRLKTTAATDGARDRDIALSPSVTESAFNSATNRTTVRFTLDFATASAIVEVFIDPTVLTALGGTQRLDLDGDDVQGEAGEDDYIDYLAVTGGTAVAGNLRNPLAAFPFAGGALPGAAGVTTITYNYGDVAVDNTDYKATFDSMLRIEKFNQTTSAWDNVAYTSTYSTATGAFVLTIPATVNGEVYRSRAVRPGTAWPVAAKTVNGYARKVSTFQMVSQTPIAGPQAVGADATYNLTAGYTVTTVFSGGQNGYVQLNIGGIGVEGIMASSVTAANLRLYDVDAGVYVPWSSAVVRQQTAGAAQKNNQVILYLSPAYQQQGDSFQVEIGPGVIDQGATTATTDDVKLGDWTNTTVLPLGWDIELDDGSTI